MLKPPITYRATFVNWSGAVVTVEVQARQTIGYDNETVWYGLAYPLGCGKYAATPRDAVARLVRDHGTRIVSIDEVTS